MHVVLATQRPSVDVITGMIKANFPSRIGYRVAQKVDSRTILDEMGAELLLGKGDMLVKLNGSSETRRVQCPFVSEEEVSALTDHLRTQGTPQYHDAILAAAEDEKSGPATATSPSTPASTKRSAIVAETQRCSTSWLQRKMTDRLQPRGKDRRDDGEARHGGSAEWRSRPGSPAPSTEFLASAGATAVRQSGRARSFAARARLHL